MTTNAVPTPIRPPRDSPFTTLTRLSTNTSPASMDSPTATLTSLLKKAAADHPDRRALFVPGRFALTHSALDRLVDDAASFLSSCGIRHGDVVALAFPNTVEFVITFLAVIRSRAVAAPLNSVYTKEEFGFYLSDAEARVLITNKEGNSAAEYAAAKLRIPHATAVLDSSLAITPFSVRPTKEDGSSASPPPAAGSIDPSDVALFLHTSGTTSRPKGVPLTQSNLAASARNIIVSYGLSPGDSTVLVLPLFHVHGLVAALLSSLAAAASITLPTSGRFSASSFWSDMTASSATWYTAVPTIHQILLDRHDATPEPKLTYPPLRFIRSCSAALAPAVLQRMEETFKAPVLEAYAMTEASHQMTTNPLEGRRVGSVGRATGAVEVAVLGEDGERCPAGVKGEVCVRGPNVTRGYKRNPEANKAAFQYGWFHTGDVGYVDGDGYVFLVGRIKELINRGGEKISPIEVDAVLLSHPDVAQAVAFGVPDDKYGEEINCAVVPREGEKIDEVELQHFCRKNLAAFKVPKKVFVADSLPETATGKIQRRVVAEHFLSQISVAKVPKFGA